MSGRFWEHLAGIGTTIALGGDRCGRILGFHKGPSSKRRKPPTPALNPLEPMAIFKSKESIDMKPAAQLWAEEEARVMIARAKAETEAKAAAKAKADREWNEEARNRAEAKVQAREQAIAEEEARIDATGKNAWFYIQNDEQFGPIELTESRQIPTQLLSAFSIMFLYSTADNRS